MYDLQDRYCVVTGANRGIGAQIAIDLARAGATVIAACRHDGDLVASKLHRQGWSADHVHVDLASRDSVRACAATLIERHPTLHALIHNAGVYTAHRTESDDGDELNMAVHFLGPFLLTSLLLPALQRGAPSRIVNVIDETYVNGRIDIEDPQITRDWTPEGARDRAKLAMLSHTLELSRRLVGTKVTANCVHPGLALTHLHDEQPLWRRLHNATLGRSKFESVASAATHVVRVAADPMLAGVSGRYYNLDREEVVSDAARDPQVADHLWRYAAARVGLHRPDSALTSG
jgi:NAD(P)-dependent dehydrogenase (short-subunit alcohol dehydrogenase family)